VKADAPTHWLRGMTTHRTHTSIEYMLQDSTQAHWLTVTSQHIVTNQPPRTVY